MGRHNIDPLEYIGKVYRNYTIVSYAGKSRSRNKKYKNYFRHIFLCKCSCGRTKEVSLINLLYGNMKGCKDCKKVNGLRNNATKHPLYVRWKQIMMRCYDQKDFYYKIYGGCGIKVCKRWHKFENFIKDVHIEKGKSFILVDRRKSYSPANCKWMDHKEKGEHRARTHTELSISKLAKLTGYSKERIRQLSGRAGDKYVNNILEAFVEKKIKLNKTIKIIYNEKAIDFLIKRKKLSSASDSTGKLRGNSI